MPRHRNRTLRRLALATLLGVACTLSLCLLFSFRSAAAQRTVWLNVVPHAGALSVAGHDRSLGKSIITWAPLRDAERAVFERTGVHGPARIPAGSITPPAWSSFWNGRDITDARASQSPASRVRADIAVGWPFRAFACTRAADHTRDAIPLPVMAADRGIGYVIAEVRAIPLRPIWRGVALNVLFFALAAYAMLICVGVRARHRGARPTIERRPRPLTAVVVTSLVLGLLTTAGIAVALPMTMRERSVTRGCTTRPDTYHVADTLWTRTTTRLSPDELRTLTPATARALDDALRTLHYTTDPARRARTPRTPEPDTLPAGPAAPTPEPTSFTSTRTGWPFACLWGASWQSGDEPAHTVHLAAAPHLQGVASVLTRGVDPMPARPIWTGWILNTLIFAGAWWSIGRLQRRRAHAERPHQFTRRHEDAAHARAA